MARIVFTLEDGTEIEAELDSDVITIGRHSDSIVVLPSGSVSSHHATVKRRGDSYYVQDLGTTNGTKLNGVEVEEAKLEDGDQLTFGDIPAVVHLTEATRMIPSAIPLPAFSAVPAGAPPLPSKTSGSSSGSASLPPPSARPQQVAQMARVSGVRGRAPSHSRAVQYKESTGCAGFLTFLFFLVLAFLIGLHVRHGVVTGGFLLQDVLTKLRDKTESSVEKHAEPEKPAEGNAKPEGGKAPAGGTAPAAPAPGAAAPAVPAPGAPAPAAGGAMMDTMN